MCIQVGYYKTVLVLRGVLFWVHMALQIKEHTQYVNKSSDADTDTINRESIPYFTLKENLYY